MSPDAASRRSKNWISVSSNAASGILLMKAIRTHSAPLELSTPAGRKLFFSAQRGRTRPPSMINGMSLPPNRCARSFPPSCSGLVQRLTQVLEYVVDMLDPHTKTNHLWCDSYFRLFLRRQLSVRSRRRVTRQRFGVAHVNHALEQTEGVEALPPSLIAALHPKGEQRAEVGAQISMRHRIQRIIRKSDVVNPFHHRMSAQEFRYLACVLNVAFNAEGKRRNPLQKQKAVKRRQSCTGIALTHSPAARDKCGISVVIHIHNTVIGNLRPIKHVEFLRILSPRELASIHNHPADAGTAPSDEFRHRVHHHIGAILDGSQQNWRSDRVVDHQRHSMLVCHSC